MSPVDFSPTHSEHANILTGYHCSQHRWGGAKAAVKISCGVGAGLPSRVAGGVVAGYAHTQLNLSLTRPSSHLWPL